MRPIHGLAVAVGVAFIVVGCLNPDAKWHEENPNGRAAENYLAPTGPLEVFSMIFRATSKRWSGAATRP